MSSASVRLALVSDAHAPAVARRCVRETLLEWSLDDLCDDCQLATSELVTNAVRHGRPPVELLLSVEEGVLELAVSDGDGPALRAVGADDLAEGGRGLVLVRAVTDELRVERVPHAGKRLVARWQVPRSLTSGQAMAGTDGSSVSDECTTPSASSSSDHRR
jgi:anti-sigma regulatory factor (Ser/Thr protein kinase)